VANGERDQKSEAPPDWAAFAKGTASQGYVRGRQRSAEDKMTKHEWRMTKEWRSTTCPLAPACDTSQIRDPAYTQAAGTAAGRLPFNTACQGSRL